MYFTLKKYNRVLVIISGLKNRSGFDNVSNKSVKFTKNLNFIMFNDYFNVPMYTYDTILYVNFWDFSHAFLEHDQSWDIKYIVQN